MSYDVAVVGLGPAGRALTHRLLTHGLAVVALDPHPDRPWPHTLSGWQDQLPPWLPAHVVGASARDPLLRTGIDRAMRARYAVLDNDHLRAALPIDGADVRERTVDDRELGRLRRLASLVVDARGAHPAGRRSRHRPGRQTTVQGEGSAESRAEGHDTAPEQTAYGVIAEPAQVAALFGDAEAVLMDWRHYGGLATWGAERPTFLYAIPLPGGRALIEETCLAGQPGTTQAELRRRLTIRAQRAGVTTEVLSSGEVERVRIPLRREGRHRRAVYRFGAAGAESNPFSGYSAFASLAAADRLARDLALGLRPTRLPPDQPSLVRRRALRALLELSGDHTVALFEAFSRLPTERQLTVLDAHSERAALSVGLAAQWWALPPPAQAALMRATLGPRRRPDHADRT